MGKDKDLWRITGDETDHKSLTGGLMSWIETVRRAQAELTKRDADPLREKVEAVVRGMEAVSTVALPDLLGLPKTTGNGRRIAPTCAPWDLFRSSHAASCRAATVTPSPVVGRDPFAKLEIRPPRGSQLSR